MHGLGRRVARVLLSITVGGVIWAVSVGVRSEPADPCPPLLATIESGLERVESAAAARDVGLDADFAHTADAYGAFAANVEAIHASRGGPIDSARGDLVAALRGTSDALRAVHGAVQAAKPGDVPAAKERLVTHGRAARETIGHVTALCRGR